MWRAGVGWLKTISGGVEWCGVGRGLEDAADQFVEIVVTKAGLRRFFVSAALFEPVQQLRRRSALLDLIRMDS